MVILKNKKTVLLGAAIIFIVFLHAWSLLRYPGINVDEAWLISRAWAFNQTGHQFGALDSGLFDSYPYHWIVNQWLITFLQGMFLRLSVVPSLWPVRLMSLATGFGLLGCNYAIGYKLAGFPLAWGSTLLLAFSRAFFYSAHMARYDILAVFFGYAALVLVIAGAKEKLWIGLLAGIVLGLAVETHLNSLIFIPAVGILYFIDFGWQFIAKPGFWGYLLGLGVGALYYLLLHVFPNPGIYAGINSLVFGKAYTAPLLTFDMVKIMSGFGDSGMLLLVAGFSLVPLGLIQIYPILKTKSKQEIIILGINLVLFGGMSLIFPKKNAQYAIYLAPAFFWLVALFLIDFVKRPWIRKIWNYFYLALVWGAILGALLSISMQLIPNNYQDYLDIQAQVKPFINQDDTIMGNQWYWLGLYDHKYYSWELLFLYPRINPGKTLQDAFNYYRPTVLIIDQPLDDLIVDNVDPNSIWYSYHLSKVEMDLYLNQHGRLSGSIPGGIFGKVRVYRFNWQ